LILAGTGWASTANADSLVTTNLGPQMSEFVNAASEVAHQYHTIPFKVGVDNTLPPEAYAGAQPGFIGINRQYVLNPALLSAYFANDVAHNYHSPGCSAQSYLGYHEAAHQIYYTHGRRAADPTVYWVRNTKWTKGTLSGYSFDENGNFVVAEALAEAFASVKCDPAGSTQAEYELFNILVGTP
jgi:hypothetical protein